jgi:hypothetical protein
MNDKPPKFKDIFVSLASVFFVVGLLRVLERFIDEAHLFEPTKNGWLMGPSLLIFFAVATVCFTMGAVIVSFITRFLYGNIDYTDSDRKAMGRLSRWSAGILFAMAVFLIGTSCLLGSRASCPTAPIVLIVPGLYLLLYSLSKKIHLLR